MSCENGTLHEALHTKDETRVELLWSSRVDVAIHVAGALQYLHEFEQPAVHQNVTSQNVLFNSERDGRLSDRSLASVLPSSHQMRELLHLGYGALELKSGRYTYLSDVYSFDDLQSLLEMVDPSLRVVCSSKSLSRFADVISQCVQPEPVLRPPM